MNVKEFLKPSGLKILIFLFIGIVYSYFAKESVCAVSFFFAFCYNAHGFPFQYMITGGIEGASSNANKFFLGEYFGRFGGFLFNPVAFALNLVLVYLLACFISILFKNMKYSRLTK
ncbi:hypothetical protein HYY71_00920 [Candidatus Woesearchaeota archaeon]|nr:hypothetical protein [Candidatus Woesearchaeota archaeon]